MTKAQRQHARSRVASRRQDQRAPRSGCHDGERRPDADHHRPGASASASKAPSAGPGATTRKRLGPICAGAILHPRGRDFVRGCQHGEPSGPSFTCAIVGSNATLSCIRIRRWATNCRASSATQSGTVRSSLRSALRGNSLGASRPRTGSVKPASRAARRHEACGSVRGASRVDTRGPVAAGCRPVDWLLGSRWLC
jgi:hypothetical protein